MAATAKVIELKGNINSPESAEHIITFEGGSISVCRTSNNQYWAHIYVNKALISDIASKSKIGVIEDFRFDTHDNGNQEIELPNNINHFAVRISTT